jgi:hypothetical protein
MQAGRAGAGRLGGWAAACGAVADRAEEMRGRRWTSENQAESGRTGEEEESGDFQEWTESLAGPKREEEKENGKEFLFIFRIYFREKNNLEIAR